MNKITSLHEQIGDSVKQDVILAPYSTFKIGGKAEYYYVAESKEDMIKAVVASKKLGMPFFLLAGSSNIILPEDGIAGLVVRNMISYKTTIEDTDTYEIIEVGSGYPMTRLAKETADLGLSGLEYHLGLPGTIGGAVVMNSKWTHPRAYVGDLVESVEVLDNKGSIQTKSKADCDFSYGWSRFQDTKEIILSVKLKLEKKDPGVLIKNAREALEYRKKTQPFGVFTSGCFFKNIGEQSAGELIDKAGLKGFQVGDLMVSDIHANFIVNKGKGTVKDLKALLSIIKRKVKEKFNVELKEEVVIL